MLILGVPLIIFSIKILGKLNALKTLAGMLLLSFCVKLTSSLSQITVTEDVLLAAITGALVLGLGQDLILRLDGSTVETNLIALMINKLIPSISRSKYLMMLTKVF